MVPHEPLDLRNHVADISVLEASDVAMRCFIPDVGEPRDLLLNQHVVDASLRQISVHLVQLHRFPIRRPDRDAVVHAQRPQRRLKDHAGNDCCCNRVPGREQFSGLFKLFVEEFGVDEAARTDFK